MRLGGWLQAVRLGSLGRLLSQGHGASVNSRRQLCPHCCPETRAPLLLHGRDSGCWIVLISSLIFASPNPAAETASDSELVSALEDSSPDLQTLLLPFRWHATASHSASPASPSDSRWFHTCSWSNWTLVVTHRQNQCSSISEWTSKFMLQSMGSNSTIGKNRQLIYIQQHGSIGSISKWRGIKEPLDEGERGEWKS